MQKKLILLALCFLFTAPAFSQGLKEESVNKILRDLYSLQKENNIKTSFAETDAKTAAPAEKFSIKAEALTSLLEKNKEEQENFNNFIAANRPKPYLTKNLSAAFTDILQKSVEREKNYYIKGFFSKSNIVNTCNLYAYFTARAVLNKSLPFKAEGYTLKAAYLVRVKPMADPNAGRGTASFIDIPRLKTAGNKYNFKHEDGRMQKVWNFHMTPVFAVQDKEGALFLIVTDPFLYNRAVTFGEWIERFNTFSVVLIDRFKEDASLNKNRVYIKEK